jgi:hypothetical protein
MACVAALMANGWGWFVLILLAVILGALGVRRIIRGAPSKGSRRRRAHLTPFFARSSRFGNAQPLRCNARRACCGLVKANGG